MNQKYFNELITALSNKIISVDLFFDIMEKYKNNDFLFYPIEKNKFYFLYEENWLDNNKLFNSTIEINNKFINLYSIYKILYQKKIDNQLQTLEQNNFYQKLFTFCKDINSNKFYFTSLIFDPFYLNEKDILEFNNLLKSKHVPKNYILKNNIFKYFLINLHYYANYNNIFEKLLQTDSFIDNKNNEDLQTFIYFLDKKIINIHPVFKDKIISFKNNSLSNYIFNYDSDIIYTDTFFINKPELLNSLSKNINNFNSFKQYIDIYTNLSSSELTFNKIEDISCDYSKINLNEFIPFIKYKYMDHIEARSILKKEFKKILTHIAHDDDFHQIFEIEHYFFLDNKKSIIDSYLNKGFFKLIKNSNLKLNPEQKIYLEKNEINANLNNNFKINNLSFKI